MWAPIWGGSVGTLPDRGGVAALAAWSREAGYWQLAPRSVDAVNAGSGGTLGTASAGGVLVGSVALVAVGGALCVAWLVALRSKITAVTTKAATRPATATVTPMTIGTVWLRG